jgi:hypothetical protein
MVFQLSFSYPGKQPKFRLKFRQRGEGNPGRRIALILAGERPKRRQGIVRCDPILSMDGRAMLTSHLLPFAIVTTVTIVVMGYSAIGRARRGSDSRPKN